MIRAILLYLLMGSAYAYSLNEVREFLAFSDSERLLSNQSLGLITRPFGARKSLIEFYRPNSILKLCLNYRIPYKDKVKGQVQFVEMNKSKDCLEEKSGGLIYDNAGQLKVQKDEYKLILFFREQILTFKFYNRNSNYVWNEGPKEAYAPREYAAWDDKSWRCREVLDNCEIKGEDLCHLCPGGTYTVLRSKCAQKQDAYCGVNQCGNKNYPACVRHIFAGNEFFSSGCYSKTDIGLCGKGLQTICDKDKNVICY